MFDTRLRIFTFNCVIIIVQALLLIAAALMVLLLVKDLALEFLKGQLLVYDRIDGCLVARIDDLIVGSDSPSVEGKAAPRRLLGRHRLVVQLDTFPAWLTESGLWDQHHLRSPLRVGVQR